MKSNLHKKYIKKTITTNTITSVSCEHHLKSPFFK